MIVQFISFMHPLDWVIVWRGNFFWKLLMYIHYFEICRAWKIVEGINFTHAAAPIVVRALFHSGWVRGCRRGCGEPSVVAGENEPAWSHEDKFSSVSHSPRELLNFMLNKLAFVNFNTFKVLYLSFMHRSTSCNFVIVPRSFSFFFF